MTRSEKRRRFLQAAKMMCKFMPCSDVFFVVILVVLACGSHFLLEIENKVFYLLLGFAANSIRHVFQKTGR